MKHLLKVSGSSSALVVALGAVFQTGYRESRRWYQEGWCTRSPREARLRSRRVDDVHHFALFGEAGGARSEDGSK
jgi:hypothetical protein